MQSGNGRTHPGESGVAEVAAGFGHEPRRRGRFPASAPRSSSTGSCPRLRKLPWVAYDIWGTEATGVEEGVLAEIPVAASLGVELFYVDAGWYDGSCKNGPATGYRRGQLGSEDRVKYPGGLAEISKKVHAAGMKFGLWFAPQVCDSRLIGSAFPRNASPNATAKTSR